MNQLKPISSFVTKNSNFYVKVTIFLLLIFGFGFFNIISEDGVVHSQGGTIPTATFTNTPEPTATATNTSEPTATSTPIIEPTATFTPVIEPTATFTPVIEPTATFTPIIEPTATFTPVVTPTATFTPVVTPTATSTSVPATTLSINDVEQPEANVNTQMLFEITRSNNLSDVSLLVNTVNRRAFAGADFVGLVDVPVTFAAGGALTKTIAVTIIGEQRVEGDEFFDVELSAPVNATITKGSGRGNILNDDIATVTLAVVDAEKNEGDTGLIDYTFSATVDLLVSGGFKLAYNTVDGTATAGEDYEAKSGILEFSGAAGESKTITIQVKGDVLVEGNETFDVVFGEFSDTNNKDDFLVTAGSPQTATIIDDEGATLTVSGGTSQLEGNSGTTDYQFAVSLNQEVANPFTVEYFTNDGSATTADNDYIDNDGVLNFQGLAGETYTVTVKVNGDTKGEANELFNFSLGTITQPGGAIVIDVVGSPQVSTILNDDTGVFFIDNQDLSFGEFEEKALIPVTFSGDLDVNATVDYAVVSGTATDGADFTAVSGTLNFSAGDSVQFIEVPLINDAVEEASETFSVTISNPSQYELGEPTTAEVTIVDDDGVATLNLVATIINGDEAADSIPVELVLDRPMGKAASVTFKTINGTATAGQDFTAINTVVTIEAGETSKIVNIAVIGDTIYERNEDLTVVISDATDVLLGDTTEALVKIIEDEPIPIVTISEPRVEESFSSDVLMVFDVQLSHFAAVDIYIDFETQNGTAIGGKDFKPTAGRLRFRAGNRKSTIGIPIYSDTDSEGDETFSLVLTSNSEGAFDSPSGTISGVGTIGNTPTFRSYLPLIAK